MARITKRPEERRTELLDVAFELCRSDGFEAMSVEQITQTVGVAKGTFYHYFTSKDDLLGQLVGRFGDRLFDHLSSAAASADGTASDRIHALMQAAARFKLAEIDIAYASFLYRPENLALRHGLFSVWRERAREVLTPVIRQGQADGSIAAADPDGVTDIVLLLWFEAADHLWMRALATDGVDDFARVLLTGATTLAQAQERILGVPEGTFTVPPAPEARMLITQLYATLDRNQR